MMVCHTVSVKKKELHSTSDFNITYDTVILSNNTRKYLKASEVLIMEFIQ